MFSENCRIPLDSDQRLSVYENVGSSTIVLSPGETVKNHKYAIFNCSNVIEHKYEPFNRRFKCVRGQWIEAERNPEWTFGNNGTFPECREGTIELYLIDQIISCYKCVLNVTINF